MLRSAGAGPAELWEMSEMQDKAFTFKEVQQSTDGPINWTGSGKQELFFWILVLSDLHSL